MMTRVLGAGLFLAAVALAQSRTPVVVELFTSEGCSSCPPADRVLARLDQQQPIPGVEVIALGEHVDYWDHLGWKDRFSSPLFSARQEDFGRAFHLQDVYTPQMVVEGQIEVVGSDWPAVNKAIRRAAASPQAAVSIELKGSDTVSFRVNHLPAGARTADILLAVTEDNLETQVGAGENGGRHLRHFGVVRSLTSLGRLETDKNGAYTADARLKLQPQWNRSNLNLVLFVEDHGSRRILGASSLHL